jgi:hypothetical protein
MVIFRSVPMPGRDVNRFALSRARVYACNVKRCLAVVTLLLLCFSFLAHADEIDWAALPNDPTLPGYHEPDFCGAYATALSGKIFRLTQQQPHRVFVHFHARGTGTTQYHVFVTYVGDGKLWVADNMAGCRGSFPLDTPSADWMSHILSNTSDYDVIEESDYRSYRAEHPGP